MPIDIDTAVQQASQSFVSTMRLHGFDLPDLAADVTAEVSAQLAEAASRFVSRRQATVEEIRARTAALENAFKPIDRDDIYRCPFAFVEAGRVSAP